MPRYYSHRNIDLNYLCCYANAEIYDDHVLFFNRILDTSVRLDGIREINESLLKKLDMGISDDDLISFLEKNYPSDIPAADKYIHMLKNGIIE